MATNILAVGTTAATSSSITLLSGEIANVFMIPGPSGFPNSASVSIEIQAASGAWVPVGGLSLGRSSIGVSLPGASINGPGVFRLRRGEVDVSFGVDRA